jgi:hypothetical protein
LPEVYFNSPVRTRIPCLDTPCSAAAAGTAEKFLVRPARQSQTLLKKHAIEPLSGNIALDYWNAAASFLLKSKTNESGRGECKARIAAFIFEREALLHGD